MKKLFRLNAMLLLIALITIVANVRIASGQTGKEKQIPIPENISQIFQNSCMPCHGAEGGRLPASKLNFSRWAGYGAAKEEEKASRICSVVTKETMPPKSARKLKPERIPTKEQVVLICNWAESLKSMKGEK